MVFINKYALKTTIVLFLIFSSFNIKGQNTDQKQTRQTNWQQNVDYDISVKLDDKNHTLIGNIKFTYTNNSPQTLNVIRFHLWANAYSSNFTDFALQQKRNGNSRFANAPLDQKGFMKNIDFSSHGKKLQMTYLDTYKEWLEIKLAQPIKTGETIELESPFFVKIPHSFSRLGHNSKAYQITQWYPKPAVYDVNGWNMLHYLDQGEFYSEFGEFNVNITVPKNYIVAATGELKTRSELQFIDNIINNKSSEIIKDSKSAMFKTINFRQQNIHDFAWFADKRFKIYKDSIHLTNEKKVDIYLYKFKSNATKNSKKILNTNNNELTEQHNQSIDKTNKVLLQNISSIKKAIKFYSENVGNYPYSHCSVVEGALKAGGGMEYPMITVIPNLNEEVIVHEVGHNWFQGILASNERTYPWMDEGINSFYEQECMNQIKIDKKDSLYKSSSNNPNSVFEVNAESFNLDQAMGDPSESFSNSGYWLGVYSQPTQAFTYLKLYLGINLFKKSMKNYYDQWAFRHPLPGDIQDVFEKTTGKDLSWFFVDMISKNMSIDYKISSVKAVKNTNNQYQITVKNTKKSTPPFPITISNDKIDTTIWVKGFTGKKEIIFKGEKAQIFTIDAYNLSGDKNIFNNSIDINKGNFLSKIPRLKIGINRKSFTKKTITILPALSWNNNDQLMPGIILTNAIGVKKINYILLPQYSIKNKAFKGYFNINSRIKMPAPKSNLIIDIAGATYGMAYDKRYQKIKTGLSYEIRKHSLPKNIFKAIDLNYHFINKDRYSFSKETFFSQNYFKVLDMGYTRINHIKNNKSEFKATTQLGIIQTNSTPIPRDDIPFYRIFAHIKKEIPYVAKNKKLKVSFFGGISHTTKNVSDSRVSFKGGGMNSTSDITFSQPFLDRGALTSNSFWARQLMNNYGSIRIPAISNLEFNAFTLKVESTLPGKLFFRPYFDATVSYRHINNSYYNRQWSYVIGLSVPVIEDVLEFYFPVYYDGGVKDYLELNQRTKFHQTINFKLNLAKISRLIYKAI